MPALRTRLRAQCGFTMIELVVVGVVLIILAGIAIPSFLNARKSTQRKATIAAAQSYKKALDAYKLDRAGLVPTAVGVAGEWQNANAGPQDPLGAPYIRGVPEQVEDNQVVITGGSAPSGVSAITYRARGTTSYALTVHVAGNPECHLTDGAPDPATTLPVCDR